MVIERLFFFLLIFHAFVWISLQFGQMDAVTRQRALSIYEKNPEISVVAKVEFPIGKKLFHLVVNPGTWLGARPWTWNWYKLQET